MEISEWRTEIMKGLQTMEVMLVFITDDFSESMWCHQEVGFALGKRVPIVSLKLGQKDPPGFISHVQAQRGKVDKPSQSASDLFPLIGKALGRQERLHEILIGSFLTAPNYIDAKARFERMADSVDKLSETHCERIISAFRSNDQLYNSMYLVNKSNRLKKFLDLPPPSGPIGLLVD